MRKQWIAIIGTGSLLIGITAGRASWAGKGTPEVRNGTIQVLNQAEASFPSLAKITHEQAIQKALAVVPGQILKTELENEDGFLVYGVEVVDAKKAIMEVKVDAGSGAILATELDKPDDEDHESGEGENK